MAYHCNACSYRGQTSGTAGECPACGSFDLHRKSLQSQKPLPARWRIYFLIALWTYLIGLVAWKLYT